MNRHFDVGLCYAALRAAQNCLVGVVASALDGGKEQSAAAWAGLNCRDVGPNRYWHVAIQKERGIDRVGKVMEHGTLLQA
jgi:hypothetical protein